MKDRRRFALLVAFAAFLLPTGPVRADSREAAIVENANAVLTELAAIPLKGVPPALLRDAQGVAVLPGIVKAGLMVGGRHGRGVLLVREPDGSWGPPVFITLSGASFGHQLGFQVTDLVLIFRTRHGLERMKKGKLTLGADVAVAAGPLGREAELATDAQLKTGVLSYSRTKGLFAGASVEGAALLLHQAATEAYYRSVQGGQGGPAAPGVPASVRLQMELTRLSTAPPPVVVVPAAAGSFGPPPVHPSPAAPPW